MGLPTSARKSGVTYTCMWPAGDLAGRFRPVEQASHSGGAAQSPVGYGLELPKNEICSQTGKIWIDVERYTPSEEQEPMDIVYIDNRELITILTKHRGFVN